MKYSLSALLTLLAFGLLSCASAQKVVPLESVPPDAPAQTIEVTAQKYHFTPEEIRVMRGTVVRLVLQSLDAEHGIAIPRYGQGTVTVEFYAREPGIYDFHCSNFCGLGHWGMDGKVIVEKE